MENLGRRSAWDTFHLDCATFTKEAKAKGFVVGLERLDNRCGFAVLIAGRGGVFAVKEYTDLDIVEDGGDILEDLRGTMAVMLEKVEEANKAEEANKQVEEKFTNKEILEILKASQVAVDYSNYFVSSAGRELWKI